MLVFGSAGASGRRFQELWVLGEADAGLDGGGEGGEKTFAGGEEEGVRDLADAVDGDGFGGGEGGEGGDRDFDVEGDDAAGGGVGKVCRSSQFHFQSTW